MQRQHDNEVIGYGDFKYVEDSALFEMITTQLPYNSALANLSMTSKAMQLRVLNLPCGDYVKALKALQPSHLRSFLAADYGFPAFAIGGSALCMGLGAYLNYETIVSTYLGSLAGAAVGSAMFWSTGGYLIEGFEGAKKGLFACINFNSPIPLVKWTLKMELMAIDKIVSMATMNEVNIFQNTIVKESLQELMTERSKTMLASLSIFKQTNRDFKADLEEKTSKIQADLSHPIERNDNVSHQL
jgi:hypothetical protein